MRVFVNGSQEVDPRLVKHIIRQYEKEKFDKIRQEAVDAEIVERKEDVQKTEGTVGEVSS